MISFLIKLCCNGCFSVCGRLCMCAVALPTVTGLQLFDVTHSSMKARWDSVDGASGYMLLYTPLTDDGDFDEKEVVEVQCTRMTIRNPNMINAKVYGVSLDKGAGWSVRAGAGWVNPSYGVQCYCLCPFWRGAQWPCYKPGNYMWVMEYTFTHTFLSLCGPLSVAIILNNNNPLCKIKSYRSNWTDEHCTLEIWDISKCPQTIQRHINRWFFMSLQYHWALPATSSSLTSLTTQLTSAGILHPKESQVTASCGSRPMG